MLANRLRKNLKKYKSMLKIHKTNAFRVYNKDIPEIPYYIDIYDQTAIVFEKGRADAVDESTRENKQAEIITALQEVLDIPKEQVFIKSRIVHDRKSQYSTLETQNRDFFVQEGEARFIIKPNQYLDCGLFLDHRNLRKKIYENSRDKKLLNLFSYTGSFSIQAILGEAKHCTNVDMSKTYLNWFVDNANINKISSSSYTNINENALEWLKNSADLYRSFDIIILDPPSFSNSKSMRGTFDVQRDHSFLVRRTMEYLKKDGVLYFSNNKLKFELEPTLSHYYEIQEITSKTVPLDFSKSNIHNCYKICWK